MAGITRRPAGSDDEPFLRALDAELRGPLFAGWDAEAAAQMLALQYDARRAARAGAREEVIVVDGRPVGAVVADDAVDCLHVLDLALVPAARGRGLGSALMRELLDDRRAARVEVAAGNAAALRFYERMGFQADGEGDGITVTLRRPSGRSTG